MSFLPTSERHWRPEPGIPIVGPERSKSAARWWFRPVLDLDDDGAALAAASTHRRDTDTAATPLQLVNQRGDHPRARCGDGMPQAATTSGEVDELLVDAVLAA